MAASLIGGLIADGFDADNLAVVDIDQSQLDHLKQRFQIHTYSDAASAVADADAVVLSVKPQVLQTVAESLATAIQTKPALVISVAAGVRSDDIERWLGGNVAVVRAMPNTPALVQCGASGLYANNKVSAHQREVAESIIRATGLAVWVDDEDQMNMVTALSGSGPAYFFRIMESLEAAATNLGLPQKTAHLLTLQTALGAAKLAMESADDMKALREGVTSPGGTTEQGLKIMHEQDIDALFEDVLKAAYQRAQELAQQLGGS